MTGKLRVGLAWLLVMAFLALSTPTTPALLLGGAVSVVGLAVRTWAAGWLDKGSVLATGGPYAHTRNPLYLGSFVVGLGLGIAGGHWAWPLAFALFFTVVYVPTMRREAQELTARYGAGYERYAAQVPSFGPRLTAYSAKVGEAETPAATGSGPSAGEQPGRLVPDRFRWSRYFRYREWEAPLGAAAVLAVLVIKVRLGG